MKTVKQFVRRVLVLGSISGLLSACGAPDNTETADITLDAEAFGTVESNWSVGSCDTPTAHETFTGSIPYGHVSPQSYNKCTKSYLVDLANLDANFTGPGVGGGLPARMEVDWADSRPQTKAECEASWVGLILYDRKVNGVWDESTAQRVQKYGVWTPHDPDEDLDLSGCNLNGFGQPRSSIRVTGMSPGSSYRFAATARNSSNATRKVSVQTYPRQVIR